MAAVNQDMPERDLDPTERDTIPPPSYAYVEASNLQIRCVGLGAVASLAAAIGCDDPVDLWHTEATE